jgi:hypothetical protein
MAISLRCTGCRSSLKLRDDLAGKKVKCPRCQTALVVPETDEDLVEVAVEEKRTRKSTGKTGRLQRDQPGPSRKNQIRIGRKRAEDEEEQEEEEAPRKKKKKGDKDSKYKPCPQCGAEGATRVKWTAWGSFYGPALFTHVQCPECNYCYNGKTGRSNMLAASMFVAIPLIGILAIIGVVFYIIAQRGHMSF